MRCLVLHLDGPMMSFGGVAVDSNRVTEDHPGLSMLTGLIGSALGYVHADVPKLERLQSRIRYAVRRDRQGQRVDDYQTVDLGQAHLMGTGWTTHGRLEERKGGEAATGTHIRNRAYFANAVFTVVLALDPAGEAPTLDDIARALVRPFRPLFLGRKGCPPGRPLLGPDESAWFVEVDDLEHALTAAPGAPGVVADRAPLTGWVPAHVDAIDGSVRLVSDVRDWANQIHGRRMVRRVRVGSQGGADV